MKYFIIILVIIVFSLVAFSKNSEIKEGVSVKNFKAQSSSGNEVEFKTLVGKWVILYFYPKDDTPGCKKEAITFSTLKPQFDGLNTIIFGINKDDLKSHKKFINKYNLTIELLYDETGEISDYFGVKTLFGMCKRDTILINPEGKIEKIYRGVNPEGNPNEILNYIKNKK